MRFTILLVFLFLSVVFGRIIREPVSDPEMVFAEEEEELAGYKCDNGKYPYSRWGELNSCEFTCKGSCSWAS